MGTLATGTAREGPMNPIVFRKDPKSDKRVVVEPAHYHIGNGDSPRTIRFENHTEEPVKVWIPNADRFLDGKGRDFSVPMNVPAQGLELSVKCDPVKPEEGKYQYHVYCEAIRDFAEGNSPPEIHCP